MRKSTACLLSIIAFLSGVILGFLLSPVKYGIGSHSGNNSGNNSGNSSLNPIKNK